MFWLFSKPSTGCVDKALDEKFTAEIKNYKKKKLKTQQKLKTN